PKPKEIGGSEKASPATTILASVSRPPRAWGHGQPRCAAQRPGCLCSCPLSLISVVLQKGPERSRARRFCAAKRTLDGEDRSGRWRRRERGRGRRGTPPRGLGRSPISTESGFHLKPEDS